MVLLPLPWIFPPDSAILNPHSMSYFPFFGEVISRTFVFRDFVAAMGFVTSVAVASERADHHPDIDIRWNKVSIALTTHDADALTAKDTDLATEIDAYANG